MFKVFVQYRKENIMQHSDFINISKKLVALLISQNSLWTHSHIEVRDNKSKISDISFFCVDELLNDSSSHIHFFELFLQMDSDQMGSNIFLYFLHIARNIIH